MWDYLGQEIKLRFVAGFVAASQDLGSLTLRPEVGWLIADVSP